MLFAASALTLVLCAVVLGPRVMADQVIPEQDLRIARLSNVAQLVTPFRLRSEDGGRTITLIGAYADPASTVVFLREIPDVGWPDLVLADAQATAPGSNVGGKGDPLNVVGVPGAPGDYVATLDYGPRVGPDNIAHLTAHVNGLLASPPYSPAIPEELHGSWTLPFAVPVQPAIVPPHESAFQLGSWKFTIDALEVTPSLIHLQASIDGANVEEVGTQGPSAISLLDPSGTPLSSEGFRFETTTPKEQLNPAIGPPNGVRVTVRWFRPRQSGTYKLRFQFNGLVYVMPMRLPAI
jgi:hypothetical protein